jgi:hypothetical protein
MLPKLRASAAARAARAAQDATTEQERTTHSTDNNTLVVSVGVDPIGESPLPTTTATAISAAASYSHDLLPFDTSAGFTAGDSSSGAKRSDSSTSTYDVSTSAVPYTNNNTPPVSILSSAAAPRIVDLMSSDDSDSDTDSITSIDDSVVTDESEYPVHVSTVSAILPSLL